MRTVFTKARQLLIISFTKGGNMTLSNMNDSQLILVGKEIAKRMMKLADALTTKQRLIGANQTAAASVIKDAEDWLQETSKRPKLAKAFESLREVLSKMKEALKPLLPSAN